MIDSEDIIDHNERIVKVSETVDKEVQTFYTIWDRHLGYWRSTSLIDEYDAWTRDLTKRAKFHTRNQAKRELANIQQWRRGES